MRPKTLLATAVLVVSMFAFSCATDDEQSTPVQGFLEIPNSLGFGSDDDGVLVQFVRVENDSRCAAGVQCVRAGEAFVVLSTTVDDKTPVESRLELLPGGQASTEVDRFTITVLDLRPDPPSVDGVRQSEYEIELKVQEN